MPLQCPHCQSTIVLEGRPPGEIVCASCGSSIQLDTGGTAGWLPEEAPKRLGKFEFLEQLGVGSFGTVYKARDTDLDRLVAVKIPRGGSIPKAEDMDRFLREARSAAQLKHPGIVALHDAGTIDGTCCLVSEFIQGATLAEQLSAKRFSVRQAAELIAEVADALHYAHQHGVVHRDIKPSNIMLDLEGRPHLMDFGLAKRAADEITMTLEGQVLGTPAYMSPEQARGEARRVDARSDLYSLGVILYELLTGELPFRGQTRMLLVQVIQDEPRPPRSLNDRIPRDLETICLKAMAKEPARRYATARDLADDLRRFLKGESIQARRISAWRRAILWARRRPAAAALLLVSGLAALGLVGASVAFVYNLQLHDKNVKLEEALHRVEVEKYFRHIAEASNGLRTGNMTKVARLLEECPVGLRNWEWHYLQRQCHADLLTLPGYTGNVTLSVAFSPDGKWLAASGNEPKLTVWDLRTGLKHHLTLPGPKSPPWGLAFSPDSRLLAWGGPNKVLPGGGNVCTVCVWDVTTGKVVRELESDEPLRLAKLAFSPDGTRIAAGSLGGAATVWDLKTGRLLPTFRPGGSEGNAIFSVAFSPVGQQLALGCGDWTGAVEVWDLSTDKPTLRLAGKNPAPIRDLAFSPNGERLALACEDKTVRIWDVAARQELPPLRGHTGWVQGVAYSPDGQHLASASADGTVRLWNATSGQEVRSFRGHTRGVGSVAFSPDGLRLASAGSDETVKIWDVRLPQESLPIGRGNYSRTGLLFSPDGKRLASGEGKIVKIWDAASRQVIHPLEGHTDSVCCFSFSRDGKRLASGDSAGRVKVWNLDTRECIWNLNDDGHSNTVAGLAFNNEGTQLVSSGHDGRLKVWDLATGRKACNDLLHFQYWINEVAFSPDGKWLAVGAAEDSKQYVTLWDTTTWERVPRTFEEGHTRGVYGVAFSPDGKQLATASQDQTVCIWEVATGRLIRTLEGHSGSVFKVSFSKDGRRLVSAGYGPMRIWDTTRWDEVLVLDSQDSILTVAFCPDGHWITTSDQNGTLNLWDGRPWDNGAAAELAAEREASGLLDSLFARPLCKNDVREHLRDSSTIRPQARQMALALADRFHEETDPKKYHAAAWPVIRHPYSNVFMCQFAVAQMEAACRLAKENATYRIALGVAQYRLGKFQKERYPEALVTLTRCDQDQPATQAFLVMTQHQLGQKDQAQAALARLRTAMKKPEWDKDQEARNFLREAEAVVNAKAGGLEK